MAAFAERYAYGPTRVQYENKDPRGHAEFKRMLAEHSAIGSANTQQGVQKERPSLYTLVEEMKRITVPTLIITGDEDWPCLLPGILMKQSIPSAALVGDAELRPRDQHRGAGRNTTGSSAIFSPRSKAAAGRSAIPARSAPRSPA